MMKIQVILAEFPCSVRILKKHKNAQTMEKTNEEKKISILLKTDDEDSSYPCGVFLLCEDT
jgi:hypothetical protein